jgi:hypothetical protein
VTVLVISSPSLAFCFSDLPGPKFYDDVRHHSLLSKRPVKKRRSAITAALSAISALTKNAVSRPKELAEYSSAIQIALTHFKNELARAKSMPEESDLDEASPMERKVLHWLTQVPLIRDLDGDYEIIAQFELGKYLKQLDPSYHHPEYRVDFLLRIAMDTKQYQMVIEYDGFEFHFEKGVQSGLINSTTWRSYLTSEDLEREKVLESFGVPIIRLNRFNVGKDPVARIDGLVREGLDGMLNSGGLHDVVAKAAERAGEIEAGLKTGGYKRCKKCDRDPPIEMFQDSNAKSGVGRFCRHCKSQSPGLDKPRFSRRYKRG